MREGNQKANNFWIKAPNALKFLCDTVEKALVLLLLLTIPFRRRSSQILSFLSLAY
jgi:hypothetical protein